MKFRDHQALLFPEKQSFVVSDAPLTFSQALSVGYKNGSFTVAPTTKQQATIQASVESIADAIAAGIPIYGITAPYGARAYFNNQVPKEQLLSYAKAVSESIAHVDVSTGPALPPELVRIAMLVRLRGFLEGVSGVRKDTISLYASLVQEDIIPVVGSYGSLGASGDLAQNGRVLSVLRQLPHTKVWDGNKQVVAKTLLRKNGFKPLEAAPKEGLALVNGDNFSVAAAVLATRTVLQRVYLAHVTTAVLYEVLEGFDEVFSPVFSKARPHTGQAFSASVLRAALRHSTKTKATQDSAKTNGVRIQDKYSMRCTPQFFGPMFDSLTHHIETLEVSLSSVSDNPLYDASQPLDSAWVSGGNFLGSYAAEVLDSLRVQLIKLTKLHDRHLALLVSPRDNNGLPANLSGTTSNAQCVFKGVQNQMGMYEVYASLCAQPVVSQFGVHEEGNQDVTPHGLSSWLMLQQLSDVSEYATASLCLALAQAIDLRGGPETFGPVARTLYKVVREQVAFTKKEQPLGHEIEKVRETLFAHDTVETLIQSLE